MTPFDKIAQTRDNLRRSSLLSSAAVERGTFVDIRFVQCDTSIRVYHGLNAQRASRSKLHVKKLPRCKSRMYAIVYIYRSTSAGTVLPQTFSLRLNQLDPGDLSLTALSSKVVSYNGWVSRKVKSFLNLPWTRVRRPRDNPESDTLILIQSWVEGGTLRSYAETPYTSYHRSYQGVQTPGFRKLKKKDLPINDYGLVLLKRGDYGEYLHNTYHNAQGQLERDDVFTTPFGIPGGDSEPSFDGTLYDKALKSLAARAQSDATSNVALNVAQIQLTVDMIAKSARRISGSLLALKRGNFKAAAKILWQNQRARYGPNGGPKTGSSLASNWLELQYGWKPLLSDVRGSMEALARYNYANSAVKTVTSGSTKLVTSDVPLMTNDANPTRLGNLFIETRYAVRLGIRYNLESPLVAFLAQTGFTNPVNLAWELIPFSFVVDWFLPIGPYLETLGQWDGLRFKDGYRVDFVRKRTLGRKYFSGKTNISADGWHTEHYGLYSSLWVKHRRLRLSSFPSASIPQVRSGLNVTRALNALALMRVVFGK